MSKNHTLSSTQPVVYVTLLPAYLLCCVLSCVCCITVIIGLPWADWRTADVQSRRSFTYSARKVEYRGNILWYRPFQNDYCVHLCTGCMLCFGQSAFFRFNHPEEAFRMKSMRPEGQQRFSTNKGNASSWPYTHPHTHTCSDDAFNMNVTPIDK